MSFRVPFTFNSLQTKVKKGINNKSWARKHNFWVPPPTSDKQFLHAGPSWNVCERKDNFCLLISLERHTQDLEPDWPGFQSELCQSLTIILSEPQDLISKKGQCIICLMARLWGPMSLAHDNHYKTRAIFIQSSLCVREEYGKGVTWAL